MRSQTCVRQTKFRSDHLSLPSLYLSLLDRSDEGRTPETSAFKLFKVANSRYQLCW